MTRREWMMAAAAAPALAQANADQQFIDAANEYIVKYLESRPQSATYLGEHRYDDRLDDVSVEGRKRKLAMNETFLKRLRAIRPDRLTGSNRIDYRVLVSRIEGEIWEETKLRDHEWNPMQYNPGTSIYLLLNREFAPLEKRLESVKQRLAGIPAYLEAARTNLKQPTRIHTETAIGQTKGTINLLRNVVGQHASVRAEQERAIAALESWGAWLEKELLPRATRDFRIGEELYRAKLRNSLESSLTAEQIATQARKDLADTQAVMYETARKLNGAGSDRKSAIRAVLDKLAGQRPDAATIVAQAKRELVDATEFVRKHNIVTVYQTPLQIVEMPEFQRGVAVASCASPGPLEREGVTFFNISPPPANWSAAQVESYFREYNDYMLRNLTVHEAMPGHYLQRSHANRFEAPTLVRAIFSSGTFTEGWAVYAERVMADNGYGGPEVRMQQMKMRLRMIVNALLDQGVHMHNMTEQAAMDLMMNEGFQERSEAAGKWRRACLTSAQLSTYYVGATEIDQLRNAYEKKNGGLGNQRAFHDKLLSFGSPAPAHARELMGLS